MAIIDYTYFISEIAVAQRSQDEVLEDLEFKIKKYEKDFLVKMFGFDMYEDFINGIEQSPIEEKWDQLLTGRHEWMGFENDEKQSIIANYVYYFYTRDLYLQATGSGNVKPENENSRTMIPVYKQVRAWNEMVDWICVLHKFLRSNISDYPNYKWRNISDPCCRSICVCGCSCGKRFPFVKINSLNI